MMVIWFIWEKKKHDSDEEKEKAQKKTTFENYISINGYDSGLTKLNCGVPQGSVLGSVQGSVLLFLLYINDLNQAIKFCNVHHFADDTNLLYLGKSIKKLNKFVNIDLKNLVNWLNTNKTKMSKKLKW